ncbi:MAG: choice-of-anchor D domain-containing protein [Deltaproteobacteria bacterium]|nr:choice-of-anchor D domain-containing protein [Deltaproteobacteria bacterium]
MKKSLELSVILFFYLILQTCSQDFYADLPCITNDDCPKGYHCEANESGKMICVKGEIEQTAGITITPDEINFGDVQLRDRKTEQLTITNKSPSKTKITIALEFTNKSDELSLEKKTVTINYNDSIKVGVSYAPKKIGPLPQNQLNVFLSTESKSTKVKNVLLFGKGIDPTISAEPDVIDFGKLYPGNKSEPKPIKILNATGGALKITNIYINEHTTNDASTSEISEFDISELPTLPTPLNEKDAFIEIKAQFKPKKAGVKLAHLIVENTDIDTPKLTVTLKGEGANCDTNYYDINGKPEDGCEYYCAPKLKGVDVCDGEDNDCDGETDNAPPDEACPLKDKGKKHVATTACIEKNGDKICIIAECEPNYWDNDGVYDNGCEAECVKSNGGIEACDGADNDCNGKTDELNPNVMCKPVMNTSEAKCEKGMCEYVCNYGYGNCDDNWDTGCETDVKNNANHCGKCKNPCAPPNAIGMCSDTLCKIVSCQTGYYDINKKVEDGCEYQCIPEGQEKCDGKDNDCDGNIDNGDIRILCPTDIHTTFACDKGVCKITSCSPNWYDLDGNINNGCECQAYDSYKGADNCLGATDLGTFASAKQSLDIQTNLLPPGRVAWYKATFRDDVNEDISQGRDLFHINIRISSNPQNQYSLDIYEGDCQSGKVYLKCAQEDYHYSTDFRTGSGTSAVGENPCYGSGNVPNKNQCTDSTKTIYFRIFRDSGVTPTCESANVRIDFTR